MGFIKAKDIVDELCQCGHLQSAHDAADHQVIAVKGHGACRLCGCAKYTFSRFITKDEIQFYLRQGELEGK